ncbi:hypothetical protein BRM21_00450 [Xanthomonas oryzae pv. oryzae]|uniref:Uncharacterized protein n=1 Tax=Xanthomonas oryzae pv. oryzae (strain PXO99A) TaxID=360094 RepID=A0A0K0GFZ6_XANOP|nr:hypothetical protein PXO_03847 [Xanthomonas oryzae pv. oryzae PXO99A]AWK20139.1 hypothetical protein B9W05_17425 [Xanthomonas oryzae pv. oryzae]AXI19280.1 hypothetical protein CDO19_23185 [Xanthomonas oryzae pv. oryzae]AXI23271.1 hypothetical protein CDO11_23210 [Xanthomonas oryzae pv. oryzae]AXM11410.1 hypothetical protein BRM60_23180 [Xanthomonas oryzae pv. oryzae]
MNSCSRGGKKQKASHRNICISAQTIATCRLRSASARPSFASSQKMLALPQLRLKKAARCSEAEDAMPIPGEATHRLYRAGGRKACCAARCERRCGTANGRIGRWGRRTGTCASTRPTGTACVRTAHICRRNPAHPTGHYPATTAAQRLQQTGLYRPAPPRPPAPSSASA